MTNWQAKKLGNIGLFTKGLGIPKDSAHSGEIPAVRYGELYTLFDTFIGRVASRIDSDTAQSATKITKGDILFAGSGETIDEIGKSAVYQIDQDGYAGGDIIIMRPNPDQNPSFLGYILNSSVARKQLRRFGQGQSVVHVYRKDLEMLKLHIPEKPEQERIVGVLEVWDEYIEKLEQKIALKEQLKKGLMQQLLTGKRRLPGFTKEWEKRRFADIADVARGKMLTSTSLTQGKYPVVAGGKTSPYSHGDYTHEDVVTVSGSGASAGYVAYHGYKIWASDCSVVEGKNGVSITKYLSLFLKYNQERLYALQSGGAQPHVYPSDIKMLNIELPEISEQESIVKVLCVLDEDIEKLSDKSSSIKLQKKYLLKNLITGTIRTPEDLQPLDTPRLERSAL